MNQSQKGRSLRIDILPSLGRVKPEEWAALEDPHNPFLDYAFLRLLEETGCVGPGTGWVPAHITVWSEQTLLGAAPTYIKTDSYGEFIFDWEWAGIARRFGISYYPKLVVGVPFTPATGPRLLVRPQEDPDLIRRLLVQGMREVMDAADASSIHVLFCNDEEAAFFEECDFSRRATHQFHWRNNGYEDFDAFLGALRSQNRKQLRKERRRVEEEGLTLSLHRGDQLDQAQWRTLYRLYTSTSDRKWGNPYLTRSFFERARRELGQTALIGFASRGDQIVAGTLSFAKGKHVYGRYWGCFEQVDNLHFELCYYQLIDHAIRSGCTLVEAGAQGSHKLKRGFLPVIIHSAHLFRHPILSQVFNEYASREAEAANVEIANAQSYGPFREEMIPPFPPLAGISLGE
ncbi:MAG: GNAT family N-acetyltransferase [Myxococcales bacterium]|nr:GNAT family N-acetyltransferase [Myxococcales bacterium]